MALRRKLLFWVALGLLLAPGVVYGCGPFFNSAVFAFLNRPDVPEPDFAAGRLGIIHPGFRPSYLAVAYRYLTGLKLTPERQKEALAVWAHSVPERASAEDELVNWSKARNEIPNLPPPPAVSVYAPAGEYSQFLNCPAGAFQNAVKTLDERAAKLGAASTVLRDWVAAQDQVFANCAGVAHLVPAALGSGSSLARADRAYQIAAAHFYARDYDEAAREFDAIAKDPSSPWAAISPYLAARAWLRQATLAGKKGEAFDPAAMSLAQQRLEKIVAGPRSNPFREASLKLLNFVHFRTEPEKRVAELDRVLLSANPEANFQQDLWDYTLLLSEDKQAGDPSDWVQTFKSLNAGSEDRTSAQRAASVKHALLRWHETRSMPWLIAALAGGATQKPGLQPLLSAADQVPRSSPAYLTVRYYALRLRATKEPDAVRKELDALLNSKDSKLSLGARNLLNEERLQVATSLQDFLEHAAETPVPSEVDFDTMENVPASAPPAKPSEPLFNHYAAEIFARRLPLTTLQQAAASPTLPKPLRREMARAAWVRSVLIGDWETADKLQTALRETDLPLWKSMDGFRSAPGGTEKRFAAILVILDNPGMKPSVREGLLRSENLGEIDAYRDNWWCADMEAGLNYGKNYDADMNLKFVFREPDFPFPGWVTETQRNAVAGEWTTLSQSGAAPNYLTGQVLAYAQAHPSDPRVPKALHLAVRSTRFGCTNVETTKFSKAAFDLLHARYPQSEWTAKTKYHY